VLGTYRTGPGRDRAADFLRDAKGIEREHRKNATDRQPCAGCGDTGRLFAYRRAGSEDPWTLACKLACFERAEDKAKLRAFGRDLLEGFRDGLLEQ
jgi:hypothetical protein